MSVGASVILRAARIEECEGLSQLCFRSKAIWGYDSKFMDVCRNELVITPRTLAMSHVQVAESEGAVVGIVEVTINGTTAMLDKLFVDPSALRNGAGRRLFDWARVKAIECGATALVIESDPQAVGFYRCMGAIEDGSVESSSVAGRFIPRLRLSL